jgi:hypothetical protein
VPVWTRSALGRWCALPATRGPCGCGHRIDRMLATDRQGHAGAHSTVQSSGGTSKPSPVATSIGLNHASGPLERLPGTFGLASVGAPDRSPSSWQPEPSFFTQCCALQTWSVHNHGADLALDVTADSAEGMAAVQAMFAPLSGSARARQVAPRGLVRQYRKRSITRNRRVVAPSPRPSP